jgi:hypothetical protein
MGWFGDKASMSEQAPTNKNDAQVPVPPVARPTARRRLLKTGLIAGPVALVTAGKPVKTLASSAYCSFSGWNSINVVEKGKTGKSKSKIAKLASVSPTGSCNPGNPPSYYYTTEGSKYEAQNWPSSFNSVTLTPGTKSGDTIFTNMFPIGDSYGGMSSDYVINILGGSPNSVEALIIAVAFSSVQVTNFPYSQAEVVQLWNTYGNDTASDGSSMNYSEALQSFLSQLV